MSHEEPASDVLAFLEKQGFSVTPTTLARWHRSGLIPRPRTEYLGQGRGTESLYPSGTSRQVLAICDLKQRFYNLNDVGFCLWLNGYPVGEAFSIRYLKAAGERLDQIISRLKVGREKLDSDDDGVADEAWSQFEKIGTAKTSIKFVRKLRKRVGAKNFDGAGLVCIDILLGHFNGFNSEDHHSFMRIMMGLRVIKVGILNGVLAWLKNSIEDPLIQLSALFAQQSFSLQISSESLESLNEARIEFQQLFFGLTNFAWKISEVLKIKLPGYYQLYEVMKYANGFDLAIIFLMWCRIRRSSWASGYPEIIQALQRAGFTSALEKQ